LATRVLDQVIEHAEERDDSEAKQADYEHQHSDHVALVVVLFLNAKGGGDVGLGERGGLHFEPSLGRGLLEHTVCLCRFLSNDVSGLLAK
jgi:hypothetical protein